MSIKLKTYYIFTYKCPLLFCRLNFIGLVDGFDIYKTMGSALLHYRSDLECIIAVQCTPEQGHGDLDEIRMINT